MYFTMFFTMFFTTLKCTVLARALRRCAAARPGCGALPSREPRRRRWLAATDPLGRVLLLERESGATP